MGKITLIIGGARSGKSSFALKLAKDSGKRAIFLATAEALDDEMHLRIKKHKNSRPASWGTMEESEDIAKAISRMPEIYGYLIVDCLTLLMSNLIMIGESDNEIRNKIKDALSAIKKRKIDAVIVSNEVGLGIVPENALARRFRDLAGSVNQDVAKFSDAVYLVSAGISVKLK